jgi:hypothetical protein
MSVWRYHGMLSVVVYNSNHPAVQRVYWNNPHIRYNLYHATRVITFSEFQRMLLWVAGGVGLSIWAFYCAFILIFTHRLSYIKEVQWCGRCGHSTAHDWRLSRLFFVRFMLHYAALVLVAKIMLIFTVLLSLQNLKPFLTHSPHVAWRNCSNWNKNEHRLYVYNRHVQLQTGCDRLFSVKTVKTAPSYRRTSLWAKILIKITWRMMFVVKATYIESTEK